MHGSLLMVGLSGPEVTAEETALIRELRPVGFTLGAHNLLSAGQTRGLTDSLRRLCPRQPLVAVVHAGGPSSPIRGIAAAGPSAAGLAMLADSKTTGTAGMLTGELLRMLGVNFNFGPVLDLARHPLAEDSHPDDRWGGDPQRVMDHAGQWNRWLRKRGIASCAGFFPAGGRAAAGAPDELPTVAAGLEELLRGDLLPYTALMPELDAIQIGHLAIPQLDPEWPASLSPRVIRRLLRDQLGFDHGVVMPDTLENHTILRRYGLGPAAQLAIEAGNDLVRIGSSPAAAREAAAALACLPQPVLAEAWERVERLRDKLHWPTPWSEEGFAETCAKLTTLTDQLAAPDCGR